MAENRRGARRLVRRAVGVLLALALLSALAPTAGADITPVAISLAGIFAIGTFLVNATLAAYNITGTIEGPHDPKFARWPRAVVASAVASSVCGIVAIAIVAM